MTLTNKRILNWILPMVLCAGFTVLASPLSSDFRSEQMKYPRVKDAFEEKLMVIRTQLTLKGIDTNAFEIYIRAFKMEEYMEVWARNIGTETYTSVFTYPLCSTVGDLGPKREQGDLQIPEGIYHISQFNPLSDNHLSLKVSYPNRSDSILGVNGNLGGAIYMHGGCASVGCLPITDDKIKELYVLSVLAKNGGQTKIPVHIYPLRMNLANFRMLEKLPNYQKQNKLWMSLRTCYNYFEMKGSLPNIYIDDAGLYMFQQPSTN